VIFENSSLSSAVNVQNTEVRRCRRWSL